MRAGCSHLWASHNPDPSQLRLLTANCGVLGPQAALTAVCQQRHGLLMCLLRWAP